MTLQYWVSHAWHGGVVKVERVFANTSTSIRQARRFVAEAIVNRAPAMCDSVVLMVSELATNSVRHADTEFRVAVAVTRRQIRVEVSDAGSGVPTRRSTTPADLSGRGLAIVEKLASDWGVRRDRAGGKTVWFTVPVASYQMS
jgi:anti-sigma regulatory factor (Ser/Thr protein kinase)